MTMEAEIGVLKLQAKEPQGLLSSHQLEKGHRTNSPSEPPEETNLANNYFKFLFIDCFFREIEKHGSVVTLIFALIGRCLCVP